MQISLIRNLQPSEKPRRKKEKDLIEMLDKITLITVIRVEEPNYTQYDIRIQSILSAGQISQ